MNKYKYKFEIASYRDGEQKTPEQIAEIANNEKPEDRYNEDEGILHGLKPGECCVEANTGGILLRNNDDSVIYCGVDYIYRNHKESIKRLGGFKENTAFKLIERTCKLDAYCQVMSALKGGNLDFVKTMLEYKIAGHSEWVGKQPLVYNFCTQNFDARTPEKEFNELTEEELNELEASLDKKAKDGGRELLKDVRCVGPKN